MLNNAVINSEQSVIRQGVFDGKVQDSFLNNAVLNSNNFRCDQAAYGDINKSSLTNSAYVAENTNIIQSGIINSQICNTTLFSSNTNISQVIDNPENIIKSNLNNLVLFSNNTRIEEVNLAGVNGCLIAIGCDGYGKIVDGLTDTNFFTLVIGNHVIIDKVFNFF